MAIDLAPVCFETGVVEVLRFSQDDTGAGVVPDIPYLAHLRCKAENSLFRISRAAGA